jgi:hypothetical protein
MILPHRITVPTSAGVSTITTQTAHGLSTNDNINLNFIAIGTLAGITAPTNPVNLNGYYTVSGITSTTLNTFQLTLVQQAQSGGTAPTYNGSGGTTNMFSGSGMNTTSHITFPVNGYCLERQSGVGLSTNNATVIYVSHNVTPPTRCGVFTSVQPVVFGSAQTLNNGAGADTNSGQSAFVGIGRDFAILQAVFAGTSQRT